MRNNPLVNTHFDITHDWLVANNAADYVPSAMLVSLLETEEIACAIQRLVEDETLRAKLSQKGLERAKLFSWNKIAELTW